MPADVAEFWLIRHGSTATSSVAIAGRAEGAPLDPRGSAEVSALAERLARSAIEVVYASPLERTRRTAQLIAERIRCKVQVLESLTELDYGSWTGQRFDELSQDAQWQRFNCFRSAVRIPGGESMLEAQARAVCAVWRLRELHPTGRIAIVTHADIIRALVMHVLGTALDLFFQLEVEPASITRLALAADSARVLCLNDVAHLRELEY
jgi:probable phosphoglycerate mutase